MHASENRMYEHFLNLHSLLEVDPLDERVFKSDQLVDLTLRTNVAGQIEALIRVGDWRDRRKGKKSDRTTTRGLMESFSYCVNKYIGGKWARYCQECETVDCQHAKKRWRTKNDGQHKKQYVWDYKRVPFDHEHAIH